MQIKVNKKQVNQAHLNADVKTGEIKARSNIALPYETHTVVFGNFKVKANQTDLVIVALCEALRLKGIVCQQLTVLPGEEVDVKLCLVNPTTAQVMIGKEDLVATVRAITVPKQETVKKGKDAETSQDDTENSDESEDSDSND
ncbi:MAG: hypothetical protein FVQ80_11520 [Planctomycetes bacterium]|nr:hypothetical protein [Planctomycetota bacterium]